MAKPYIRYLPAKLKPITAPAVSIPLTIFVLLSLLLWEYYQNPGWFERSTIPNANPKSALTPDEQAKLAEIDTVDLLLESARRSGSLYTLDTAPSSSSSSNSSNSPANDIDKSADGIESEDPSTGSESNTNRRLANRSNPFGRYTSEYEFSGAARPNASSTTTGQSFSNATTAPSAYAAPSGFGSATGSTTPSSVPNAFSDAISQQQVIKAGKGPRDRELNRFSSPTENTAQGSTNSVQPPFQLSAPTIRTAPAMSPPAGTTGYQAPPTTDLPAFNLSPQQTTRNPLTTTSQFGTISPRPIGNVQAVPSDKPSLSIPTSPTGTIYTAPNSIQPEQNQRAR